MVDIKRAKDIIRAEHIWKRYGPILALRDLTIEVPPGIFGFVGPNGAGKTTFMKILAGLLTPDKGHVTILGSPVSIKNKKEVGFVYDKGMFPPEIDVGYFLEKIQKIYGVSSIEKREVIEICNLKDVLNKKIGHLSAGYKRRLNLATAIMHSPELLIMDEPFNEIDPISRMKIKDAIQTLSNNGINFFISSHNLVELEEIVTHYGIIVDGKIVKQDSLFSHDNNRYVLIKGDNVMKIVDVFTKYGYKAERRGAYVSINTDIKKIYDLLKEYPGEIYEIKTMSLEEELKGAVEK